MLGGFFIALSGLGIPTVGFGFILGDAEAIGVHVTKIGGGFGVALLSGLFKPGAGLGVILGDTLTFLVQQS